MWSFQWKFYAITIRTMRAMTKKFMKWTFSENYSFIKICNLTKISKF